MTDGDELLDTAQAYMYLTVSRATLYRELRRGRIKCIKVRGSTRWRRSELDRDLRAAEREARGRVA